MDVIETDAGGPERGMMHDGCRTLAEMFGLWLVENVRIVVGGAIWFKASKGYLDLPINYLSLGLVLTSGQIWYLGSYHSEQIHPFDKSSKLRDGSDNGNMPKQIG